MKLNKLLDYIPDSALVGIKEGEEVIYAGEVRNISLETYRKFEGKKVLLIDSELWIDGQNPEIFIIVKKRGE